MSWLITAKQYIPAVIGEPFGGGFFAGYISHTADGNPTHALIVAPRATGAVNSNSIAWKTTATATANTGSMFDGAANTAAMVAAGIANHPAAQFCVNLSIAGFTDWYLPSALEFDIAYFNLKPSTGSNVITSTSGINAYSVPRRNSVWTAESPAQTTVALFAGGTEALALDSWSSTESSAANAYDWRPSNGDLRPNISKTTNRNVRAFRRIAL